MGKKIFFKEKNKITKGRKGMDGKRRTKNKDNKERIVTNTVTTHSFLILYINYINNHHECKWSQCTN